MTVYKIQAERSTFFAFDDNENGRLDVKESVFLDADHNQKISAADVVIPQKALAELLTPYGVRSLRGLLLPSLEKYTALFREFKQCEADGSVAFYWQLYSALAMAGLELGLSKKTLGKVFPNVGQINDDYRAAYDRTLSRIEAGILAGDQGPGIGFAISALLKMMDEAEESRKKLGLSQVVFSGTDAKGLYQRLCAAYQAREKIVRPQILGLSASKSYQEENLFNDGGKSLRELAYTEKTTIIASYLMLRYWDHFFSLLSEHPEMEISSDLSALLIPLAPVVIREFLDEGELEAAALTWRAFELSPVLADADFLSEGLLVQKAITAAAIQSLKAGDQSTYQAYLTLLREPLDGLLPESQTQQAFQKLAFYQSVLSADRAGLTHINDVPSTDDFEIGLLSSEEASDLIALIKQPAIKAQLRLLFPDTQNSPVQAVPTMRKRRGQITVEE